MKPAILVTGSSGLIGAETVLFFDRLGWTVYGIDNNLRKHFFGDFGDTQGTLEILSKNTHHFQHFPLDIRQRDSMLNFFESRRLDLIVHCAAQPSHDFAREDPLMDFDINAVGTMNLLEAFRLYAPKAVFVHFSTNKVYGDVPNELALVELETRWDYARKEDYEGITESMRIDQSKHSLFGASKVASSIMAQEYGRYFGLKIGIFRGGCLTGPLHAGAELHGFLSYLIRAGMSDLEYHVYGYKGKQVRDQLHSFDVVTAIYEFYQNPRYGEVYNLGGGRQNSISILEAIRKFEAMTGRGFRWKYVEEPREGDHICYISDMSKFRAHYSQWKITKTLDDIFHEILEVTCKTPLSQKKP